MRDETEFASRRAGELRSGVHALDVGPGALRTDAVTTGCRRRAVVYWAPGPLPGGLTPPTRRAGAIEPPPAGPGTRPTERVLVPSVLASRV